ncbi:MAG: DUF1800 family protein [Saprospiraceae bacterium]
MASLSLYGGGAIGNQLAAHLMRRSTYTYSKNDIEAFALKTADQAVDDLFSFVAPSIPEPIDFQSGNHWINLGGAPVSASFHLNRYIKGWWIDEAMKSTSVEYKMMFFLHTTFTTSVYDHKSEDFWDYLETIRYYVKGSFKEFAIKMSLTNLMADFLGNRVNFGFSPNDNFAREFLELFTIGKGPQNGPGDYTNYTEDDVLEATKVFSGWRNGVRTNPAHKDSDTNLNRCYPVFAYHSNVNKQFSSHFQSTTITTATSATDMYRELEDFVDLVFDQLETARHLARRRYRFFVSSNITSEIETDIINPLAQLIYDNNYNLEIGLKALLKSEHFFDMDDSTNGDEIIGGLVKSPLDLLTTAVSFFQIERPNPVTSSFWHYIQFYHRATLSDTFENAGFNIFSPLSVAGYSAYHQSPEYDRNWIHTGTVVPRYKMGGMLISGFRWTANELIGASLDVTDFVVNSGYFSDPQNSTTLVTEILEYLLPFAADTNRFNYFLNDIFLNNLSATDWQTEWNNYLSSGNDSSVKIPLKNLVESILHSQEFQAF